MLVAEKMDEIMEAVLHLQPEICVEGLCLHGWGSAVPKHTGFVSVSYG